MRGGRSIPPPLLLPLFPLAQERYRFRLVVEESLSFGVLGQTGRGLTEHWGLPVRAIDIICASMGNAVGSIGGFCVGERKVVDHQVRGSRGGKRSDTRMSKK